MGGAHTMSFLESRMTKENLLSEWLKEKLEDAYEQIENVQKSNKILKNNLKIVVKEKQMLKTTFQQKMQNQVYLFENEKKEKNLKISDLNEQLFRAEIRFVEKTEEYQTILDNLFLKTQHYERENAEKDEQIKELEEKLFTTAAVLNLTAVGLRNMKKVNKKMEQNLKKLEKSRRGLMCQLKTKGSTLNRIRQKRTEYRTQLNEAKAKLARIQKLKNASL